MHPSMFNNLPDPIDVLKGCVIVAVLCVLGGLGIGYLIWH